VGSIVTRIKTSAWVSIGLALLLGPLQLEAAVGPLQLEAAVGPDSPEAPLVQLPTPGKPHSPREFPTPSRQLPTPGKPHPPIIIETPREVKIELAGDVLFDFDQWDIRPDAEPTLRQVVEIIQRYPKSKVAMAGYTDAKGADAYNLQLSARRATSVKAWLVQHSGIDGKRMTTKGRGEADPVAPNTHPDGSDNPEGRQRNRRVELTVKK
jgi:outer membrane protein OmpA-like peptidoglycan-associated protein